MGISRIFPRIGLGGGPGGSRRPRIITFRKIARLINWGQIPLGIRLGLEKRNKRKRTPSEARSHTRLPVNMVLNSLFGMVNDEEGGVRSLMGCVNITLYFWEALDRLTAVQ